MDYENLLAVIRRRRTIRNYKPDPVSLDDVMKVLEAARWAASGNNSQPWEFVVVRDRDRLRQVIEIMLEQNRQLREKSLNFPGASKNYLQKISTIIVVCGDPRFKRAYPQSNASEELAQMYWENSERIYIQSISAAICNILLAATSLGLGTVWMSGTAERPFDQKLKEALKIPEELETICGIPLGYPPDEEPSPRMPRPLENTVHLDEFDRSKWRTDRYVERFVQDAQVRAEFYRTGHTD